MSSRNVMLLRTSLPGLELKELAPNDVESLYALIQKNRTHLTKLGDYTDLVQCSPDQLREQFSADPSQRQFGLTHVDELIGTVTLIEHQPTIYGLGYWISSDHAGRGYMTEAVRTVIEFAVDDCRAEEIWAGITPSNEPSIKLVSRLGFELARTQASHLSYCLRIGARDGT